MKLTQEKIDDIVFGFIILIKDYINNCQNDLETYISNFCDFYEERNNCIDCFRKINELLIPLVKFQLIFDKNNAVKKLKQIEI